MQPCLPTISQATIAPALDGRGKISVSPPPYTGGGLTCAEEPRGPPNRFTRHARREHVNHRCTVAVRPMERMEANLLGLGVGTLALIVERTRMDASGPVVETADMLLPADRWSVSL
ncbi:UTRA domain-containing protein [Streptomyces sp. NPDC059122]|uniref:UTRA domain-containing protein n=1 Tax=Streptomyces sp. NPDC059122 TaxID=3346732 RepID=UPI0036968188